MYTDFNKEYRMPKVIKLTELTPGKVYMARRAYSSKDITWQPVFLDINDPVKVIEAGPWHKLLLKWVDDCTSAPTSIKENPTTHEMEFVDSRGTPTLKELPEGWVKKEIKKAEAEIAFHQQRIQMLNMIQKV
jgi:hypothetical protein